MGTPSEEFSVFVTEVEPRLRRALVGLCGPEDGRDALAEALGYAWEHWDRVRRMANPAGYVYRVARSRARPRRARPLFPAEARDGTPLVEPALPRALAALPERQRVCVFLVHGSGWTHREVAELLGISASTVANHLDRAMQRLRRDLEVHVDG